MEVLKEEQWQEEVTSKLRSFEKSLIIALKEKGKAYTMKFTFETRLRNNCTYISNFWYVCKFSTTELPYSKSLFTIYLKYL